MKQYTTKLLSKQANAIKKVCPHKSTVSTDELQARTTDRVSENKKYKEKLKKKKNTALVARNISHLVIIFILWAKESGRRYKKKILPGQIISLSDSIWAVLLGAFSCALLILISNGTFSIHSLTKISQLNDFKRRWFDLSK